MKRISLAILCIIAFLAMTTFSYAQTNMQQPPPEKPHSEHWKLQWTSPVEEITSTAYMFLHEKSGAPLLYLSNEDDNKVFSITFRTPPTDSTGIAHIKEHAVLAGSERFPTKEPFVDLLKGSLQTFLNAFTADDRTIKKYPEILM